MIHQHVNQLNRKQDKLPTYCSWCWKKEHAGEEKLPDGWSATICPACRKDLTDKFPNDTLNGDIRKMSNVISQQGWQSPYILAGSLDSATFCRGSQPLPVAHQEAPDVVCGIARRVGYTGGSFHDPAIYRLMIRITTRSRKMLPALFVLEQGIFYEYEQWKHEHIACA